MTLSAAAVIVPLFLLLLTVQLHTSLTDAFFRGYSQKVSHCTTIPTSAGNRNHINHIVSGSSSIRTTTRQSQRLSFCRFDGAYTTKIGKQSSTQLQDANILPKSAADSNSSELALDFSQLGPFLQIAVPFFKQDQTARNSLLAVVGLTLANSGISVAFSYISRDFYNALNARDEPLFYEKIELFFAALVIAVPIGVFYRFAREKLSIYWREALTQNVLDKFYSNRTFYIVETMKDVDNPDQRITEDIRRFTSTSLDFFITLFTSVIDLFAFSAILFQIYPPLFVAIVLYAGAGSLVTTQLGQSLVALNYERLQREADFRFALFRTRENAEAIAFYDSEARLEREGVWALFKDALETQLGIAVAQRNLEYFTTSYRYIVQILPSLIVAPLYFAGKVELGAISQSYGAFNHILGDFSIIINQFEALSAFSAGLTRLATFIDRIDNTGWGNTTSSSSSSGSESSDAMEKMKKPLITMSVEQDASKSGSGSQWVLRCDDLTVFTPDYSRVIVGDVDTGDAKRGVAVEVSAGDQVLIVGPSGAGKSSFVRAIAGLWQVGSGTVKWNAEGFSSTKQQRHEVLQQQDKDRSDQVQHSDEAARLVQSAPAGVFFLPQKPYNLLGDLKRQIMYPNIEYDNSSSITQYDGSSSDSSELDDAFFLELLRQVRLDGLAERMGTIELRPRSANSADTGADAVAAADAAARGLRAVKDWSKVLSLGEQQRLAFARILYNKPSVVVLDEATSALDLKSEEAMYALLRGMGVTYISVGHRPTLLRYHSSKLVLNGAGKDPVCVRIDQQRADQQQELVDLAAVN